VCSRQLTAVNNPEAFTAPDLLPFSHRESALNLLPSRRSGNKSDKRISARTASEVRVLTPVNKNCWLIRNLEFRSGSAIIDWRAKWYDGLARGLVLQ